MDSVRYDQFVKADTPSIDELSEYLEKAYSSSSYTLSSMKSIVHGILPNNRTEDFFSDCKDWTKTLPEQYGGYKAYAYSGNPLFHPICFGDSGFDKFFFGSLSSDGKELLDKFKKDSPNEPFLAYFLFVDTHHPYNGETAPSEDGAKNSQQKAISYLDKLFKELYDFVPENTHFYLTSDHGELFGEHNKYGHDPRAESGGCLAYKELFEIFISEVVK